MFPLELLFFVFKFVFDLYVLFIIISIQIYQSQQEHRNNWLKIFYSRCLQNVLLTLLFTLKQFSEVIFLSSLTYYLDYYQYFLSILLFRYLIAIKTVPMVFQIITNFDHGISLLARRLIFRFNFEKQHKLFKTFYVFSIF